MFLSISLLNFVLERYAYQYENSSVHMVNFTLLLSNVSHSSFFIS